jgi:hypothetical protein
MLRLIAGFASAFALLSSAAVFGAIAGDFGSSSCTGRTAERHGKPETWLCRPAQGFVRGRFVGDDRRGERKVQKESFKAAKTRRSIASSIRRYRSIRRQQRHDRGRKSTA